MPTPEEKIKRLRLPFTDGKDPYATSPKPGSYGGKEGPLTEALRAKRARQEAKPTPAAKLSEPSEETPKSSSSSSLSSSGKSFSQAFREARSAGKDTFTWNGKKYTTEMAGAKKPAADETKFESSVPEVTDTEEGTTTTFKRGGKVNMSSASKRADGIAQRGKTRGKYV